MRCFAIWLILAPLAISTAKAMQDTAMSQLMWQTDIFTSSNFLDRTITWEGLRTGRWNPVPYYHEASPHGGYWIGVMPWNVEYRQMLTHDSIQLRFRFRSEAFFHIRSDADLARFLTVGNPPGSYYQWKKGGVLWQSMTSLLAGLVFKSGGWIMLGIGKGAQGVTEFEKGTVYFPESADTLAWNIRFWQQTIPSQAAILFSTGWKGNWDNLSLEITADQWGAFFGGGIQRAEYQSMLAYASVDPLRTPDFLDQLRESLVNLDALDSPASVALLKVVPVWGRIAVKLEYQWKRRVIGMQWYAQPHEVATYWQGRVYIPLMELDRPWQLTPFVHYDAVGSAGLGAAVEYSARWGKLNISMPFIIGLPRKSGWGGALNAQLKW